MKEKQIQLAKGFSFPAVKFATRGNAIVGIRNTGKTVTATKTAECLMDMQIPFIAFDPVGVWKNLKIGISGNKGYPVVVAGAFEGADIHLTPDNAVSIVVAAMKANVSLVIDLHHRTLANKSTWRKIVSDGIEALMEENLNYGPRHIFLEEGPEFAPQRIMPGQAIVYSTVERLARMGRNMSLGYTLISQRAEEINKAILEICEITLLHKQVGKNSMLSIQKWLDVREVKNRKEIMKSLPHLKQGECWVIGEGESGQLIKVLPKKTFHPDTDAGVTAKTSGYKPVNVSDFVKKLNEFLQSKKEPAAEKGKAAVLNNLSTKTLEDLQDRNSRLTTENNQLKAQNVELKKQLDAASGLYKRAKSYLSGVKYGLANAAKEAGLLEDLLTAIETSTAKEIAAPVSLGKQNAVSKRNIESVSNGPDSLSKSAKSILVFLARTPDKGFSKAQISVGSGYSITSSGFANALSELNVKGYIVKMDSGKIWVNPDKDISFLGKIDREPFSIATFAGKLEKCPRQLFEELLSNPTKWYERAELAENTNYSITSSGFNNGISKLNTLELIVKQGQSIKINPELLDI